MENEINYLRKKIQDLENNSDKLEEIRILGSILNKLTETVESRKLKHFDIIDCINSWDNFNIELYAEILKAKSSKRKTAEETQGNLC